MDGGGTRTRVVLMEFAEGVPRGREVARSVGPASVIRARRVRDSAMTVVRLVTGMLDDLETDAPGADRTAVDALWAGLAGAGREPVRSEVEGALRAALDGTVLRVTVGSDAQAAYHDAFADQPGILLIAGTGSGALARAATGEMLRVGGWGPQLGDEGSGYAIGLAALRAVLAARDGRGHRTALTDLLPDLGLERPDELVDWVASVPKGEVGALAGRVAQCAEAGDRVAGKVLDDAAASLVAHAVAARRRGAPPTVALVGGLVGKGGSLAGRLRPALEAAGFTVRSRPVRPEVGAALLARAATAVQPARDASA